MVDSITRVVGIDTRGEAGGNISFPVGLLTGTSKRCDPIQAGGIMTMVEHGDEDSSPTLPCVWFHALRPRSREAGLYDRPGACKSGRGFSYSDL